MKKILSCLLVVVLLCSLSVAAFADNFTSSISNPGAPTVNKTTQANGEEEDGLIIITPYAEREKLSQEKREVLEEAYDVIDKAEDLAALNDQLKAAAADKNIAASDLFDVSVVEGKEVSFPLTIELEDESENLKGFVALLHYVDGAFEWVDATVNEKEDGDTLTFTVDSLGAFTIIVEVDESASAETGEAIPYGFIIGAVVLAGAAAWFFVKSRKVKA